MNPYMSAAPTPVSPLMSHSTTPYPQTTPQQAATIQPGSITYTTTVGADGQVIYHPFKAVAASYQTASGVVNGIQWIPAEATSVLPAGATVADSTFQGGRRDDDYRRRKDDLSRGSNRYDRDRYEDDEYYRRDREDRDREDRDYRRRDRDDRDRDRAGERRLSGYGRYPGEYDKQAAADLERRMADLDLERREKDRERERDREYDRDRAATGRPRRGSHYGGERPTSTYAAAPGGSYPSANYPQNSTYAAAPGGNYPAPTTYHPPASPRPGDALPRPASPYHNPMAPGSMSSYNTGPVAPRPISPYQPGAMARAASPFQAGAMQRAASPYGGAGPLPRAPSPYGGGINRAPSPYGGGINRAASPYGGGIPPRAASPYGGPAAGGGVYPPGHVLEGQPMRGGASSPYAPPVNLYASSGAGTAPYGTQPSVYGGGYAGSGGGYAGSGGGYAGSGIGAHASPRVGSAPLDPPQQAMLSAPEGFSRPPNRAHPYTQFEMMKIGELDDLLETVPRMPAVLVPHDVYHEDWIRLMTDLAMSWAGTMPVPQYSSDGRPPKRSTLTADVIDLWNASFFRARGVEMILYKGRERRSGRYAGTVDMNLPGFDPGDVSDPSESDDSDDDSANERDRYRYGGSAGYGRQEADSRRRRKADKRQRKLDKKIRKRTKELERTYSIFLQCVPPE